MNDIRKAYVRVLLDQPSFFRFSDDSGILRTIDLGRSGIYLLSWLVKLLAFGVLGSVALMFYAHLLHAR